MIDASIKGIKITSEIVKRFWEKVDVRSPDECWPWMACAMGEGYGVLRVGIGAQAKTVLTHRIAYTLVYGTIPQCESYHGMLVRHSCDNRICCSPFHLSLGTAKDNTQDAIKRGRLTHGESVNSAKLTEAQVLELRESYARGEVTRKELVKKYGLTQSAITNIINRRYWKHI